MDGLINGCDDVTIAGRIRRIAIRISPVELDFSFVFITIMLFSIIFPFYFCKCTIQGRCSFRVVSCVGVDLQG
jgi:hypothetical protein